MATEGGGGRIISKFEEITPQKFGKAERIKECYFELNKKMFVI